MFQKRLRALLKKRNHGAFTLAELVVVITILAILAVIGLLALTGYTENADDARIESNVRSVFTAITTESAATNQSPRFYVKHDPNYALSGGIVTYDGTPTALTGWEWNEPNTNYSAGNPDYVKLRLNPAKFKVSYDPVRTFLAALPSVSAYDNADPKALLAWAADVFSALGKTPRTRSVLQVAAIKRGYATVSGNFPAWAAGSVNWLVKDTSVWASSTWALVDKLPMGALNDFSIAIVGNDSTGRNWSNGTYAANCDGYRNPITPKVYQWQTGSGTYLIDPDGTAGNPAYKAYCDMSTDGGGWTLLMRFANDTGLAYGSANWTAGTTLNSTSFDAVSNTNAVFDSYVSMPLSAVRWCRASGSDCVTAPLPAAKTGLALFSGAQTSLGSISRNQWTTLFPPDYATFPNCNMGNVNVTSGLSYMRIRFGIAGNNEADCGSSDNAWGFWLYSAYNGGSCGAGLLNFHAGACTQATIWGK